VLAAYGLWGISPLFFNLLAPTPAIEVVAHRVAWSALACVLVLAALDRLRGGASLATARRLVTQPRQLALLAGAAALITLNWLVFVYAVTHGQTLDASLGYYILPLVSVILGAVFLGERFTRRQGMALLLVAGGVVALVVGLGSLPWVTLALSVSFAVYGLLRKIAAAEALVGLFVETVLLLPFALGTLAWLEATGTAAFGLGGGPLAGRADLWALLVLGTPAWTALPLFLFAFGARRLRLSTSGLMFYLNPTLQFLIAVLVFHDPFTRPYQVAYGLIWAGLAVYAWPPRRRPGPTPEETA
jgi:chloramphenicol-sensitive protein RarD